MFDVQKFIDRLGERTKVINWVIDGLDITGLTLKDVPNIELSWLAKNYNIKDDIYPCDHLKVTEITYTLIIDGKSYSGFCEDCERMVYGTIWSNGKKAERWKS